MDAGNSEYVFETDISEGEPGLQQGINPLVAVVLGSNRRSNHHCVRAIGIPNSEVIAPSVPLTPMFSTRWVFVSTTS